VSLGDQVNSSEERKYPIQRGAIGMSQCAVWHRCDSQMKSILVVIAALTLLTPSATVAQVKKVNVGDHRPARLNDGWRTTSAEALGVDSAALEKLTNSIRTWPELGVHAIIIERSGQLIYESYFDGFDERWGQPLGPSTMTATTKHDLRSVTKSVISALTGIALGEGAIKSL